MPTISGITFSDNDKDGKFGAGDAQIAGTVQISVMCGAQAVPIMRWTSDAKTGFKFPDLLPGTYRLIRTDYSNGYGLSPAGNTGYQQVTLGTSDVTVNIGAMPVKTPAPTNPPPATQPTTPVTPPKPPTAKLAGLGAVATSSEVAGSDAQAQATVANLKKLGVASIRAFGPSCKPGGAIDTGFFVNMKRLTSRGIKVVVMCGCPENQPNGTTFNLVDWQRYAANIAAAIGGDTNFIIELQNEANLNQYFPLTVNNNADFPQRATELVSIAKIFRATMPHAFIVGPSTGWNAGPQPHIDWMQAQVNAGMLDHVDAINTHFYFTNANDVETVLSAYAKMAPGKPIYLTEVNANVPESKYPETISAILAVLKKHNTFPFVYRYCEEPSNPKWNGLCLTDSKGNINAVVAQAWAA